MIFYLLIKSQATIDILVLIYKVARPLYIHIFNETSETLAIYSHLIRARSLVLLNFYKPLF